MGEAVAQAPKQLTPYRSPADYFGAALRERRVQRQLSLRALGELVQLSGDELGKIEKADRQATEDLVSRCDQALHAGGELCGLWWLLFGRQRPVDLPDLSADRLPDRAWTARLPGGRTFPGTAIRCVPSGSREQGEPLQRRIEFSIADGRVLIGPKRGRHEFDDFTYGLIWAVSNLDDALLADDTALVVSRDRLATYEQLPGSAVSREAVPDLNAISRMWLGSDFCARHILRHLSGEGPAFWTREQRGEEASAWLLFAHKLEYLRATCRSNSEVTRTFCIPEGAVRPSPRYEKILLFLAAALMESTGITVQVCVEPEYADLEGFVLTGEREAIIANWVRSDGIWHVGTPTGRPALVDLTDASAHARNTSIVQAQTPRDRLVRLADYLDLEWGWVRNRCTQLGHRGVAGVVKPRSRLLSLEAYESACAFVGDL